MIKLYDTDSYISEFTATVISCEKHDDLYKIKLDRTAFFPTAGGQECDSGYLGGCEVVSVIEDGDDIVHILKEPIDIGKYIEGKINFEERFRKMQHHTAEHIISGFVKKLFGFENVGFHLGGTDVTMDYNGELGKKDIEMLELYANETVFENRSVRAEYPESGELEKMDYRSKLDLTENVRIVTIDGIDVCACCAPHVRSTGEIGIIKITEFMRHRGGVRMHMLCGESALNDYSVKQKNIEEISNLLSEKQETVSEGVKRILHELAEVKQERSALRRELAKLRAEKFEYTDGNMCLFAENMDKGDMMFYAEQCRKRCGGMLMVCSGNDTDGYSYIIIYEDMPDIKKMNVELCGKGGGRNGMCQGFFKANREKIEQYFNSL